MDSSNRTSHSHSLAHSTLSPSKSLSRPKIPIILRSKIHQCLKTWRLRAKKSKHRWNVLNQWAQTQKNYIRDLQLIISRIQQPMMQKQIISQSQEAILFRNIDTIIQLSRQILLVLQGFINKNNWRPAVIEISTVLLKLHPFLKIYIEYCNHYYKGQNILKMVKNLPDMLAIEKSLPMDIDSYLIKPIQRPPKYMLLLKDYKKNLPENHPDYKKLGEAIDKYHEVNEINNNAIAQQSKVAKMVYLQKLYTEAMQSNREYIRQFDASIYKTNVKVYVLTDLLLVTQLLDYKQSVYKIIHIDHNSFFSHPPDGKYFSNILFICGKYETIHLMFDSEKELKREYTVMNRLLNELEQKESMRRKLMADKKQEHEVVKVPVTLAEKKHRESVKFESFMRITVDGVEKRPVSSFKAETYYIVKYQMPKPWAFYKLAYTRYSTIEEIYGHIKKQFPQLILPELSPDIFNLGIYDQTKNRSRIMEYRCMAIEEFLNRLFRWEKIMANPIFLLEALRVDNNIWQFAINKKSCRCNLCMEQKKIVPSMEYFMSKRHKFFINKDTMPQNNFCMCNYALDQYNMPNLSLKHFNSIEKIYCYLNAVEGKTEEFRMYYAPSTEKQQVKVAFINMTKQHTVAIEVGPLTSVGEVLRKAAISIGIKFFGDFGLFVKYSGIPKLLDTDEKIYDVLNNIKSDENGGKMEQDGFFSTIKQGFNMVKKWGEEVMFGKKSKLVIKKHLFFPQHLESQAYKEDLIRFNLLTEQAFYSIYSQSVILTDKELIAVCAIFICIKSPDKLTHIKRGYFPIEALMRILPAIKRPLAESNKWMPDLIKKVQQFKEYVICQPSQSGKLQQYLLEIMEEKICWDAMMTNMTNYERSTLEGSPFNIQVGVSHKHLFVVTPKSDNLLLQIPLQVLQYKVTPFSIFIQLNQCKYRFDGKMLYNLKKVIQKYRKFQKVFGEALNCVNSSLYQSKYVSMKSMRF